MKFGITGTFDCSYLPEEKERLLVFASYQDPDLKSQYEVMLAHGFRRSGEQIYRPNCPACEACQSIRIPVIKFQASRSQKRVLARNRQVKSQVSRQHKEEYYALYERYINTRHTDGSMYPANPEQYYQFLFSSWSQPIFFEFREEGKLVMVAVTDELDDALSALYTYFDPDLAHRSLGTLAILTQIQKAYEWQKRYVYLGYQIDACQKMNYKSKFLPHERHFKDGWQLITK